MAGPLFGIETEYAIASAGCDDTDLPHDSPAHALLRAARRRLICLPDGSACSGLFLANASRFYLDAGMHPEMATAECTDPWEAVRYIEAGHRIIADLVSAVSAENTGREVVCFRSNVDLSGAETTWACHESYLHSNPAGELQAEIVPHLVTRVIYTGAGGFNPFAGGLEFTLSPRMAFFATLSSTGSTHDRGIWHEKSESLCGEQQRLHITCGDSLSSQKANFLKIGTTALVVAMADAGLNPGKAVQLQDPVRALHQIAGDVTCRKDVLLLHGEPRSPIDIQRHYLKFAEEHLNDPCMPAWASAVCTLWREVLDLLESAPDSVAGVLDWGIKYAIYAAHAANLGIPWNALPILNQPIHGISAVLAPGDDGPGRRGDRARRSRRRSAMSREAARDYLTAHNLTLQQMDAVLEARPHFFELETRFAQVGGTKGVFDALNASGVLSHSIDGIGDVDAATTQPPSGSRARLRGKVIRRLARRPAEAAWDSVIDLKKHRILDLSDPFATEEVWRRMEPWERRPRTGNFFPREEALSCYLAGDYTGAEELLRACLREGSERQSTHCHLARVMLMTDRDDEAREEIRRAWRVREPSLLYVLARLNFFECIFAALRGEPCSTWLSRLKGMLGSQLHMVWTIQPMIDRLRPRLGEDQYVFLSAVASAISDENRLPQLEAFPQWSETVADASWSGRRRRHHIAAAPPDSIDGGEWDSLTDSGSPF